jgi:phosphate-selective porin OprO and OprP
MKTSLTLKPNFSKPSVSTWALLFTLTASVSTRLGAELPLTHTFDEWWSYATLYKNDQNPILEEFKLRGRYQGQYWDTDADQGSQSNWEDRRSRFGFDAKLFDKKIEVRTDFQSNDGFNDFYDGLVDTYIRWKPTSSLSFTLGKMKPLIAQYDFLESTNTQPTFERSQIFNQLAVNRATGFTAEGSQDEFSWRAGIYSNDTPTNTGGSGAFGDGEFGDLNGGVSTTLGVGYDFTEILHTDKADVHLDWLHSDRKTGDFVLTRYDDVVSTTLVVKQNAAALVFESFFATGGDGDDSDVYGFYIQPTYDIIPKKLQLVGRYSYANSTGPLGVIAQSRYEKSVATGGARGDNYNAFYGGIQYFIYGDKLKVLAGAEWAQLKGNGQAYQGTTLLTGIRLSF